MLVSDKGRIEYLVPNRPLVRRTSEETVVFFKQLEDKEKNLYQHILSYLPLADLVLKSLQGFLDEKEESAKVTDPIAEVNKYITLYGEGSLTKSQQRFYRKAVVALTNQLRLLDAPRLWVRSVTKTIADPNQLSSLDEEFFLGKKDNQYYSWADKVMDKSSKIQQTKNLFVEDNVGLVGLLVGKRKKIQSKYSCMSFQEYLQEGVFGLIKAVDRFDYTKGFTFATYAAWWVKHAITRSTQEKSRLIRIPIHTQERSKKVLEILNEYRKTHGEDPTLEFLSKQTKRKVSTIKEMLQVQRVFSIYNMTNPDANGHANSIEDTLHDEEAISQPDELHDKKVKATLEEALKILSPRERKIIGGRFGIDNTKSDDTITLKEIGDSIGYSRERIRQMESAALEKLRDHFKSQNISL